MGTTSSSVLLAVTIFFLWRLVNDALLSDNAKTREIRAEMERTFETVHDEQRNLSLRQILPMSRETVKAKSRKNLNSKKKLGA